MPQASTVADHTRFASDDIATGLREVARIFEDNAWLGQVVAQPTIAQVVTVQLTSSEAVLSAALMFDTRIGENEHEGRVHTSTVVNSGAVHLRLFHISTPVRELRRPAAVTETLAGWDA